MATLLSMLIVFLTPPDPEFQIIYVKDPPIIVAPPWNP